MTRSHRSSNEYLYDVNRSKLGDANVNASIVSTPPSDGLLINLKQSQAGYNYYTNSSTNAGIISSGSISSTGNIGINVKGISSDLTQGSSTTNALSASAAVNTTATTTTTTTTTTSISAIDTNKNASLIQSIETIADDVYKTISNNINKNHTFSSIKSNRSNNISIISSDATVVSFKPFEDSSCIIHT